MLFSKAFLTLVVSTVVRNNSCVNFLFPKFFLANLKIIPVLLFAADFNLFNCVC